MRSDAKIKEALIIDVANKSILTLECITLTGLTIPAIYLLQMIVILAMKRLLTLR